MGKGTTAVVAGDIGKTRLASALFACPPRRRTGNPALGGFRSRNRAARPGSLPRRTALAPDPRNTSTGSKRSPRTERLAKRVPLDAGEPLVGSGRFDDPK